MNWFYYPRPNPDPPAENPKGGWCRESPKGRKHEKNKLNFVLSKFCVFVIKIFLAKMQSKHN